MSPTKSKLRLFAALAALAALALAASCRGFFPAATLSSITIQPSAPQVAFSTPSQAPLQVWGTDSNNNRSQVTSGVSWSSLSPTIVSIDANTGVPNGLALGTGQVQASVQGLTAQATATVYITNVTAITVNPKQASISIASTTLTQSFSALATVGTSSLDVTSGATFVLSPANSNVTCALNTANTPNTYDCTATATSSAEGTYTLTASYPGTSVTGQATLNVTP
jgi:hypothetical protein